MKTLIYALTLVLSVVLTDTMIYGNMRALREVTYQHSSSIEGEGAEITLNRENLSVVLPSLNLKQFEASLAKVTAVYDFTSTDKKSIPILFIGILIQNISIRVNGEKVESVFVSDPEELKTFETKYAKHCDNSGHCLKFHFTADHLKFLADYPDLKQKVGMVRFAAPVKAGDNILKIEYSQGINYREGKNSYFRDYYPEAYKFTFDYALYPSRSIALDENFILDIYVVVPDGYKKTLVFTLHEPPVVDTSLNLTKIHSEEKYQQVFRRKFRNFPADFLTVAFRYPD